MSNISEVRIFPQQGNSSKVKAYGDAVFFNALRVKFTVFQGSNGLYASLPAAKGNKPDPDTGKEKWYPNVWITDKTLYQEFQNKVLEKLSQETGEVGNQGEAPGPTNQSTVPF